MGGIFSDMGLEEGEREGLIITCVKSGERGLDIALHWLRGKREKAGHPFTWAQRRERRRDFVTLIRRRGRDFQMSVMRFRNMFMILFFIYIFIVIVVLFSFRGLLTCIHRL